MISALSREATLIYLEIGMPRHIKRTSKRPVYFHTEVGAKHSTHKSTSSQTRNVFMILKGCMGPTGIALPRTKWGKPEADDLHFVKLL